MRAVHPTEEVSVVDRLHRLVLWIAYRTMRGVWFVFRPQLRGVVVAVWQAGRLLIIRNSYRSWLGLPGGGIQRTESPLAAAVRELREEVGIAVEPDALRFVGEMGTRFEGTRCDCSLFELSLADPIDPRIDRREVVWAGFLTPEEALGARITPPLREYLESRLSGSDRR